MAAPAAGGEVREQIDELREGVAECRAQMASLSAAVDKGFAELAAQLAESSSRPRVDRSSSTYVPFGQHESPARAESDEGASPGASSSGSTPSPTRLSRASKSTRSFFSKESKRHSVGPTHGMGTVHEVSASFSHYKKEDQGSK